MVRYIKLTHYLEKRIRMLKEPADNCMAGLVVGHNELILRRKHFVFLLQTANDAINRVLKIDRLHSFLVQTSGNESALGESLNTQNF